MDGRKMGLVNMERSSNTLPSAWRFLGKTNAPWMLMPLSNPISQKRTNISPNDSALAVYHLILLLFLPIQQLFGQKNRKPKPVQIQDGPKSHATQIHYASKELKTKRQKTEFTHYFTHIRFYLKQNCTYFYFSKRRKLLNLTFK